MIERLPEKSVNCRCPEGFITDKDGSCKTLGPQIVGCRTNDECNSTTACINQHCVDPCECGLNAECRIIDHHPLCVCLEGYYGSNPKRGCEPVGCRSDDDCRQDHACRQRECTPVCGPDHKPCGGNAICKVHDTRYKKKI